MIDLKSLATRMLVLVLALVDVAQNTQQYNYAHGKDMGEFGLIDTPHSRLLGQRATELNCVNGFVQR